VLASFRISTRAGTSLRRQFTGRTGLISMSRRAPFSFPVRGLSPSTFHPSQDRRCLRFGGFPHERAFKSLTPSAGLYVRTRTMSKDDLISSRLRILVETINELESRTRSIA
jgi:hypothetical protein